MKKYYGDYIVGTQAAWIAFATKTGFNVTSLMNVARRSVTQVSGNWLWLVEVWDLNFSQLLWCWKNNLYPLKQYQARQLGTKFMYIADKDGNRILNDDLTVVTGMADEAIEWCRVFAPEMAWNLTQAQELAYIQKNNIKAKLQAMFDAFEVEIIISE